MVVAGDDELEVSGAFVQSEAADEAGGLEFHDQAVDGGLIQTGEVLDAGEVGESRGAVVGGHVVEQCFQTLAAAQSAGSKFSHAVFHQ